MNDDEAVVEELPMQVRAAALNSFDEERRTVELTFTTGARVRRYDWYRDRAYWEELVVTPEAIRSERMNNGAPLLESHSRWGLGSQLGVVERDSLRIENGQGIVRVRFSGRDSVRDIMADVRDGIVQNVSVGYIIHRVERLQEGDEWVYRVIDWEPYEVSLVSVPADNGGKVRSAVPELGQQRFPVEYIDKLAATPAQRNQEVHMNDEENTAAETRVAPAQAPNVDAERAAAAQAERDRIRAINEACRIGGMTDEFRDGHIDRGSDIAVVREAIFTEMARRQQSAANTVSAARVETVRDERETAREAMVEALMARANPNVKLTDRARQYRGMRMVDMAREAIELAGGRARGLTPREIAIAALGMDRDMMSRAGISTSDLTWITTSTIARTLRAAYEQAPRTFTTWARQSTLPDFREVARVQMSGISAFTKVDEGGEYKVVSISDAAEKYSLAKYGGIIPFTWEALINDDLGAFNRIPMAMAEEAAATESDIVYGVLSTNAALADTVALFHADHGNLAGSGGAIDEAALTAGRLAIRTQTGMNGRQLNLEPSILLVGPSAEAAARKYTSVMYVPAQQSNIAMPWNTSLQVVVEGRITGTPWYMMCAPGRIDTVEYAYLEGETGLFTETRNGFEVDGVEVKARMVFAAKAIDYRGMYKNAGQ